LYTGGADFRKNIDKTIQGYAYAKNILKVDTQLVVVCAGGTTLQNMYCDLIKKSGLSLNDVIFTNFIPDSELNVLYNNAHVTIFVSLYEGFGMPIIESINCKVPVIVSNTSSMLELFDLSSQSLFIADPYSVADIARAINDAFNIDKNKYNMYINKSFEILPLFSNRMIQTELKNAYRYALIKKSR